MFQNDQLPGFSYAGGITYMIATASEITGLMFNVVLQAPAERLKFQIACICIHVRRKVYLCVMTHQRALQWLRDTALEEAQMAAGAASSNVSTASTVCVRGKRIRMRCQLDT
jgi:hypothetical protein